SAEQIDALARRIVGGVAETVESLPNPLVEAAEDAARSAPAEAGVAQSSNSVTAFTDSRPFDESAAAELASNSAASQPVAGQQEALLPRRTHGGALPR